LGLSIAKIMKGPPEDSDTEGENVLFAEIEEASA
jgi:hypothetical protein